ncbi:MAG: alpha/beta fold hydrolase [Cyclobacteriaceae bacterium]|nr:alpha/beta fold hydrolase [Cyclobacteriaceae bacterium]
MKRIIVLLLALVASTLSWAQHGAGTKGKVLLVVSNPSVSKQTGWPIGVWAAEVTHPYWEFSEAGYTVDIASPDGGPVKFDGFSDPEDVSKYSAFDLISLGFKKDPAKMALLENTLKLSTVNPADYKALFICGGQGPMYTFIDNTELHKFFADFYLTGKPAAAICHGTAILLKTKLPNGKFLVEGKRWTGFASSEEQYADNFVGMKIQPFRIEDEARKMPNSRFEVGAPFAPHAIQDGNLITGQQQNSGTAAARLTLKALEEGASRYPNYVLVHGAWADESAWGFVRNQLAVRANVITVNLKGHGLDLATANAVRMTDYVNQVVDVIKQQKGKVILVGHSMAGMVISQVAETIPDKIEKLVYVAAYLPANGEDLLSLSAADTQSKVGGAMQFNESKTAATLAKEVIVPAVCADCPDFMKEVLVKYHKAEPTGPLGEKVTLTKANFGRVPKFYIATTNDQAVGYELQKAMIRKNGSIKKVEELPTSHLPFVVKPAEFLNALQGLQ